MHLYNRGLAGEQAPDSSNKLHQPMSRAYIQWTYDQGRESGGLQLLRKSMVKRERDQEQREPGKHHLAALRS